MWPITFGIYKSRKIIEENFSKEFKYSVEALSENGIEKIRDRTIHMINQGESLSEWVKEPNKLRKDFKEMPFSNSALLLMSMREKVAGEEYCLMLLVIWFR